jgi:hypothetical protein
MGQTFHGRATTTHAVRAAIWRSKAPLKELAAQQALNPQTVAHGGRGAFVMTPNRLEGCAFDGADGRKEATAVALRHTRSCRWTTASMPCRPQSRT